MIKARAKYEYQVGTDTMELFAFVKNQFDGKNYKVKISLEQHDVFKLGSFEEMKAVQTELIPAEELLKTIMNALWEGGMRPSGFKDIENETKAIKGHLSDMRRLVFSDHTPYNITELKE